MGINLSATLGMGQGGDKVPSPTIPKIDCINFKSFNSFDLVVYLIGLLENLYSIIHMSPQFLALVEGSKSIIKINNSNIK